MNAIVLSADIFYDGSDLVLRSSDPASHGARAIEDEHQIKRVFVVNELLDRLQPREVSVNFLDLLLEIVHIIGWSSLNDLKRSDVLS